MTTATDSYLSNISDESLEVLQHFGPEAPIKLNTYACQLEDALLEAIEHQRRQAQALAEQSQYIQKITEALNAAQAEKEAMQAILTDPDELIDYISGFFGADGPFPGELVITRCQSQAAAR